MMLRNEVSTAYIPLSLEMTVGDAHDFLAAQPGALRAVLDQGHAVTLISLDDLQFGDEPQEQTLARMLPRLPPGIIAPADIPIDSFLESGAFAALRLGARGAMLIENKQLVGAVTEDAIRRSLASHQLAGSRDRGSWSLDSTLAGGILTPKVVLYCDEFAHRNELLYYNRAKPPACQTQLPYDHPIRR